MHYFLWIDGRQRGPYALAQLQGMWSSGAVSADTYYWREGMAQGRPIDELLAGGAGAKAPTPQAARPTQKAPTPGSSRISSLRIRFQSLNPAIRVLILAFGGFGALMFACVVLGLGAAVLSSLGDSSPSAAPEERSAHRIAGSPLAPSQEDAEHAMRAALQGYLIEHKQELFSQLHWQGEAKTVQVEATSITWKGGRPSANPEDIVAVTSTGTLYWTGLVTSNGFTRFRLVIDGQGSSGLEILETNGTPKDDLKRAGAKFAGQLITNWLAGQILGGEAR